MEQNKQKDERKRSRKNRTREQSEENEINQTTHDAVVPDLVSIQSHMEPTLEEDKFPVVPLVGGVDVRGQALPEVTDGHRVTLQHLVVAHTPKPLVLQTHTFTWIRNTLERRRIMIIYEKFKMFPWFQPVKCAKLAAFLDFIFVS